MATFCLNTKKPNNYAFFCPKSRLHLTVSNPVGFANEVTPAIERALKSECILDITDNAESHKTEEPVNRPEQQPAPEQTPESEQKQAEEPEKKTRGRKKKAESEPESEKTAE